MVEVTACFFPVAFWVMVKQALEEFGFQFSDPPRMETIDWVPMVFLPYDPGADLDPALDTCYRKALDVFTQAAHRPEDHN